MTKTPFFNVHKDFAQEGQNGTIYGHEQFLGLAEDSAKAKYHQLLAAAYAASDPWTTVYIESDEGVRILWEKIDRRTVPEPEPEPEEQELQ